MSVSATVRCVLSLFITTTCLYNYDPLKPCFYIVKLGFTEVYIIFIISAQKHRLWYSLELPRRGGSNEYSQSMFLAEIWKISEFFIWKFSFFLVVKFSVYLNSLVFVMLLLISSSFEASDHEFIYFIYSYNVLTLSTLSTIFSRRQIEIFFLYSRDISCKLSFPGKLKKNIISVSPADIVQRVVTVKRVKHT